MKIIENRVKIHKFLSHFVNFIAFYSIFSRNMSIFAEKIADNGINKNGYKLSMKITIYNNFSITCPII